MGKEYRESVTMERLRKHFRVLAAQPEAKRGPVAALVRIAQDDAEELAEAQYRRGRHAGFGVGLAFGMAAAALVMSGWLG